MKDEIKEILNKIEATFETTEDNSFIKFKWLDYKQILDYITNLQDRTKELETINEEHRKLNGELREIINDAIKMLNSETLNKYYYGMSYEFGINDFKKDMLNILQGDDKE